MKMIGKQRNDTVAATEVACWVYCPEQWRLQYGLGLEPENAEALAAGRGHHARKSVAEWIAGLSITLGRLLIALAALLGLLLLWWLS